MYARVRTSSVVITQVIMGSRGYRYIGGIDTFDRYAWTFPINDNRINSLYLPIYNTFEGCSSKEALVRVWLRVGWAPAEKYLATIVGEKTTTVALPSREEIYPVDSSILFSQNS